MMQDEHPFKNLELKRLSVLLPVVFLSGGAQQASNDGIEEGNPYYSVFTVSFIYLFIYLLIYKLRLICCGDIRMPRYLWFIKMGAATGRFAI